MKRVKKDRRKLNNHGFSLVEFLIAVAILGVVSLTIYSFMNTGARFYQRTSADADIQSEAQLAANTISDLIIDCEVNISYDDTITNVVSGSPGTGTITVNGRILEISNRNYQFLIFRRDTNLFYLERRPSASDPTQYEAYNIDNAELLAQNITEFEVDLSRVSGQGKGKNIVTFVMTYEKGGRSYRGNYQVNLRNSVTVSANGITPVSDEENLTRIVISPAPITIDVKGKENPACPPEQKEREFTANSDATNVGRDDIFAWEMKGMDGGTVTCASPVGATNKKKFTIRIADDLRNVPSSFKVIATSTIRNKDTNTFASGEAMVYFKKILNLNITPTRGVTGDLMDPESSAIFAANITDYNLRPEDKKCTWRLEYKKGVNGQWAVCNNSSIATGRSYGTTYSVQLGRDADEVYTFRLTATSEWDSTWSAEYVFGVKEKPTTPGVNAPSRGVEIDLEAYFKTEEGGQYWQNGMHTPLTDDIEIYNVYIENATNYDASSDLYAVIERDGKWYAYLDFGAWAHPTSELSYYDGHWVQMKVSARTKSGATIAGWGNSNTWVQTVNWKTVDVNLTSSDPLANTNIVIPKGGSYNVSAKVIGYNLTKKNLIGIYLQGTNVNSHEVGMVDTNPYISAEYTYGLGNRYSLVEDVGYRITAKTTDTYPTGPIQVMTTLEPMYNLAKSKGQNSYMQRANYTYNVYVANVEGTGAYIQGPSSVSDWSKWSVITGTNQDGSDVERSILSLIEISQTKSFPVTVNIKAPTQAEVTFDVVRGQDGQISYFTLRYDNNTYYWNSTYNFWKRMS